MDPAPRRHARRHIARRTVAFFLLTSLANVGVLAVGGIALATGVLHGAPSPWLGLIPAIAGVLAIALALGARPVARALARRSSARGSSAGSSTSPTASTRRWRCCAPATPADLVGAAGYMLFDVAMLGVCFEAFGRDAPPAGVLLMAYLIGQLGGLIPIPAASAASTAA